MQITVSGGILQIDDEAAPELLKKYGIFVLERHPMKYAVCYRRGAGRLEKKEYLHRIVVGAKPGDVVDHIDGDTWNNKRENLRLSSMSLNGFNRKKRRGSYSSQFKGVCFCKRTGRWAASCGRKFLGRFKTEDLAAQAYNRAVSVVFNGEQVMLNGVACSK